MNRGRHKSSKTNEIVKLASQYGAHYPAAWKSGISYKNLIKLINTQKKICGFNNLHIFETNYTSCSFIEGGFLWSDTEEGHRFWKIRLDNLYNKIQIYISKLHTTQ